MLDLIRNVFFDECVEKSDACLLYCDVDTWWFDMVTMHPCELYMSIANILASAPMIHQWLLLASVFAHLELFV